MATAAANRLLLRSLNETIVVPRREDKTQEGAPSSTHKEIEENPAIECARKGIVAIQRRQAQTQQVKIPILNSYLPRPTVLQAEAVPVLYITDVDQIGERTLIIETITLIMKNEGVRSQAAMSVWASIIIDVLGPNQVDTVFRAFNNLGVTLYRTSIDHLADFFTKSYQIQLTPAKASDLTDKVYLALVCIYLLIIVKKLDGNNYAAYMTSRIASLSTKMGLSSEDRRVFICS